VHKILVVDDDRSILKVIKMRVEAEKYRVSTAIDALEALNEAKNDTFDLALVDLKLNGCDGIELMDDLHKINPEMPVIILTAHGTIKSAVEAMKKGAYSYITKPFEYHELLLQIKNCLEKSKLSREVKRLKNLLKERYSFDNIVGKSEIMQQLMAKVAQAAETDSIVFINGESGTGKELIAKALHVASSRKQGPFVAINCAAIPETLLESELFGHQRGAFTGAHQNKKGLFAQAHKGTFFLDEISEMPPNMQAKLLRVLEEKTIYPLGGEGKPIKVDTRILAASNKNLEKEVKKKNFREDLFYRIHVIPLYLPPLRERKEDIALLANHFLSRCIKETKKKIKGFSPDAMQKIFAYDWPGNVRELENAVEAAVIMADENVITADMILPTRQSENRSFKSLKVAREDFDKNYLIQLMELTQGNVSQAAKLAGKYRADFYDLLKKYHLKPEDYR
jgi:two-component system response regulator GlrR